MTITFFFWFWVWYTFVEKLSSWHIHSLKLLECIVSVKSLIAQRVIYQPFFFMVYLYHVFTLIMHLSFNMLAIFFLSLSHKIVLFQGKGLDIFVLDTVCGYLHVSFSVIASKYEWMNGRKFINYSMSSHGGQGNGLAYFFMFICFRFWMVIQKIFVIIR